MDITAELTFVIPVRIDSIERKENLDTVLSYLSTNTDASIIVLEADSEQRYNWADCSEKVKYIFIESKDPIFHKTRYVNRLLRMAETDIVSMWDTDIIIHTSQIINAVEMIKGGVTLCYPFDGCFYFLNPEQSRSARADIISVLDDQGQVEIFTRLGRTSSGGTFVANKKKYLELGGDNENFYGWGLEDTERLKRFEILEEAISWINGPLYHLYHPRGINSCFDNGMREIHGLKEFVRVCKMDKEQLTDYVNTFPWNKNNQ